MNMRKLVLALVLLSVVTAAALAADITGKWKSEMPGRDGNPMVTTYTFKVEGDKLTGTISGRQGDTPIADGKINGDDISFAVVRNFGGEERRMEYKGKVAGDEIKLSVQFGPDMPPREMVAKRVKE
jgi:hypothetical protein